MTLAQSRITHDADDKNSGGEIFNGVNHVGAQTKGNRVVAGIRILGLTLKRIDDKSILEISMEIPH